MKIIYFKTGNSTFIQRDQKILENHYSVEPYFIRNKPKYRYFFSLIRLLFFLLFRTRKYRMFFIRFADYHTALLSFFARIFGKKLVIVIGGFDVTYLPEYNYGAYNNKIRSWCVKYSLKNASLLLPNNTSLIFNENRYEQGYKRKGGIRYFAPNTKVPIKVVFNGFDTKFWEMPKGLRKENLVLTVAKIDDYRTYRIKGIDDFINVARRMPENNFLIVGMSKEKAEQFNITIPDNLTFISQFNPSDLLNVYARAKVFCSKDSASFPKIRKGVSARLRTQHDAREEDSIVEAIGQSIECRLFFKWIPGKSPKE